MPNNIQSSRGAALIVSLILLTAVTMTAVVSLQNSMLQVKMVANTQLATSAFVAANSELEANYDEIRDNENGLQMLSEAVSSVSVENDELVLRSDGNPEFSAVSARRNLNSDYSQMGVAPENITSEITYLGSGAIVSNGFAGDSTVGTFQTYPFQINASAAVNPSISSSQSMGIDYTAPSGRR